DPFDGVRAESADQLVLEVGVTDVEGRAEAGTSKERFLAGVAEPRDRGRRAAEIRDDATDGLRAAGRDDGHALSGEIAALPACQRSRPSAPPAGRGARQGRARRRRARRALPWRRPSWRAGRAAPRASGTPRHGGG